MHRLLSLMVVTLGLLFPLITDFGKNFEYEYVLMACWFVVIALPFSSIFSPLKWWGKDRKFAFSFVGEFYWAFIGIPLYSCAVVYLLKYFTNCPCSTAGTFFWLGLLGYPTLILGQALSLIVIRARQRGASSTRVFGVVSCGTLLLLLLLAAELWFSPQKKTTNLVFGFLHGPIYDTWIPIDDGVFWQRMSHLFISCALFLLVWFSRSKRWIAGFSFVFIIATYFNFRASSFPSYGSGEKRLQKYLDQSIQGGGFTLRYSSQSIKGSRSVDWLAKNIQFHINDLKKKLELERHPHITVYAYPDDDTKKILFGGGATDIADVYGATVHITKEGWNHSTLRHELVHAITSGFAFYGLGFHPNMALTEGLAVALAPRERSISLDDGAASLIKSGRVKSLGELFSPMFWRESGARSYTIAGSILNFLIDQYGIQGVKDLYAGKGWDTAFKESRKSIIRKWQKKIMAGYDESSNKILADSLYRTPGVLKDRCPHSKQDLRKNRSIGWSIRLRQPIGWYPEENYWHWRKKLDTTDRQSLLVVWKQKISKDVENVRLGPGKLEVWARALREARRNPLARIEDIEFALLESDIHSLLGNTEEGLQILKELQDQITNKKIGAGLERALLVRLRLESLLAGSLLRDWRKYLAGWKKTLPRKRNANEPWVLTYLRLRNGAKRFNDPKYLESLDKVEFDKDLPNDFIVEWFKLIAYGYIYQSNYEKAAAAWSQALKYASSSKKNAFTLYAAKSDYFRKTLESKVLSK